MVFSFEVRLFDLAKGVEMGELQEHEAGRIQRMQFGVVPREAIAELSHRSRYYYKMLFCVQWIQIYICFGATVSDITNVYAYVAPEYEA